MNCIYLRGGLALLAAAAMACSRSGDAPPVTSDAAPLMSPSGLSVSEKGMGELMAGMTVPHAEAILKTSLGPPAGVDSAACRMARWDGAPPGVSLMIDGGRIVRVDVDSGPLTTVAGARIGDSESKIQELYQNRAVVTPHKYVDGHYLTVSPPAAADSAFRLVFETAGKRVTRYRGGLRPQVEYVERCG